MVVIIGVLIICFIYWWFCCKDRPSLSSLSTSSRKIKGGLPEYDITLYTESVDGSILSFKCIGMYFKDKTHKFYVLNQLGEEYVLNELNDIFIFSLFGISAGNSNNTGIITLPKTPNERELTINGTNDINFGYLLKDKKYKYVLEYYEELNL